MPPKKIHICEDCVKFYKENEFPIHPDTWCMHEWMKAKEEALKKTKTIKKK